MCQNTEACALSPSLAFFLEVHGSWDLVSLFRIRLLVDDEAIEDTLKGRTTIQTTSKLYIGGVPEDYRNPRASSILMSSLEGSLRDFTFDAE